MKVIVVNDNETVYVMVRTKSPSAFDPAAIYGSIGRAYRVVCEDSSQFLELVPVNKAALIKAEETDRATAISSSPV